MFPILGCGGIIRTSSGTVMSPGYGVVNYPNYQICKWNITEPTGRRMRLKFDDFVIGDDKDFIEVSFLVKGNIHDYKLVAYVFLNVNGIT